MKAPKFHVGQAVVWVWDKPIPRGFVSPPGRGQVYRIRKVQPRYEDTDPRNGDWYYFLEERDDTATYPEIGFAPVEYLSDEALAQLLEEALEPVTA